MPTIIAVLNDTGPSALDGVTQTRTITLEGSSEPFGIIKLFDMNSPSTVLAEVEANNGRMDL